MKECIAILKAADAAARWHVHQKRKGTLGVPYINHLLEVATLVAEATDGKDSALVIAALLHDSIKDQEVPREMIAAAFGADVASLVEEVTDDKILRGESANGFRSSTRRGSRIARRFSSLPTRRAICVPSASTRPPTGRSNEGLTILNGPEKSPKAYGAPICVLRISLTARRRLPKRPPVQGLSRPGLLESVDGETLTAGVFARRLRGGSPRRTLARPQHGTKKAAPPLAAEHAATFTPGRPIARRNTSGLTDAQNPSRSVGDSLRIGRVGVQRRLHASGLASPSAVYCRIAGARPERARCRP